MIRAENAGNNGCQQVQCDACCLNDVDIERTPTESMNVVDLKTNKATRKDVTFLVN